MHSLREPPIALGAQEPRDDGPPMWPKLIAIVSMGGVLVFGAALVSKAKAPASTPGAGASRSGDLGPVATISTGERVDLGAYASDKGEWTIFEFTADW